MTVKRKLTVRHVFERDYEIEFKDGLEGGQLDYGSWLMMGDCMVNSGTDAHDLLTHESLFDHPVSAWRPAKGLHVHDTSLYAISQSGSHLTVDGTSIDAWLFEGEEDTRYSLDDDDGKGEAA